MDILNWLYSVKNKFLRTSVENPDKDLIALGADVSYVKRGDKYQTYVVPFGSAVAELDGNVLRTGIYDETTNGGDYIFAVGAPVLSKTTTKVIDTPAAPTFVAVDLQGWKLSGSLDINFNVPGDQVYLGSIEFDSVPFWDMFPWKTTGQVHAWDGSSYYSTLGNGSMMYDDNAGTIIPVNCYIKADFYPASTGSGYDIFFVYDQADATAQITDTTASFQFEFLTPTQVTPQYYFY